MITAIPNYKVVIYSIHKEEVYTRALHAVEAIDADLASGRRHYRDGRGTLLTTLDEVTRAILNNDLVVGEASKVGPMTAEDYRRIMRPIYRELQRRRRLKRKLASLASPPAA